MVLGAQFVVLKNEWYRCTHRSGDTIGGSRPGHCPGKILVNCAYFFVREFSCDVVAPLCMSPARVTWQF